MTADEFWNLDIGSDVRDNYHDCVGPVTGVNLEAMTVRVDDRWVPYDLVELCSTPSED